MLLTLVRQARRRLICNDLLAQAVNAICAALCAFILLLLLGTQVLAWQWALLLPISALAFGLYRVWRLLPAPYSVAQLIDSRLSLADTLSTALFFSHPSRRIQVSEAVLRWQYEQAEELSKSADVRRAIPYRVPRAAYALGGLFLVAGSLFALRYGLSRRLDLKPPLARIINQSLGGSAPAEEAKAHKKNGSKAPALKNEMGMPLSDQDQKASDLDPAGDKALDKSEIPDVDNSRSAQAQSNGKTKGDEGDRISEEQEGQSEQAQASNGDSSGDGQQGPNKPGDKQQSAANQPQNGGSGDQSSLMQKFKDAMQNLLSKMKQQPQSGSKQQTSEMAQNGRQGKQQQGTGKQKGNQGQKQQNGGQDADSQEGEPGDDAQSSQNSQAKGSGQSEDQQANKQPGSGIGKQDGSKDLKLAEQMAAMGKISEIIGKRAASVSGEATVEVQNTSQQLSTRYEGRRAVHSDAGGEISRDEVPVALQAYVQQYFEQVRKAPARK